MSSPNNVLNTVRYAHSDAPQRCCFAPVSTALCVVIAGKIINASIANKTRIHSEYELMFCQIIFYISCLLLIIMGTYIHRYIVQEQASRSSLYNDCIHNHYPESVHKYVTIVSTFDIYRLVKEVARKDKLERRDFNFVTYYYISLWLITYVFGYLIFGPSLLN